MPLINSIQDRGSLVQLLMKRLNMIGDSPIPTLMPELGANLVLEDDRPEWRALKPETYFSVTTAVAAVVAEAGGLWLPCPDNAIVVIQRIQASVATIISTGLTAPTFTLPIGVGSVYARDTRLPVLTLSSLDGTGTVFNANRVFAHADISPFQFAEPIILSPGNGLTLRTVALNTAVRFSVHGYWRRAQPGELG